MATTKKTRMAGALAGAMAALALLPGQSLAAPRVHPAFATQAMWIWELPETEQGSLQRIIARARAHRIGAVYIKAADAGNRWSQFSPAVVARLKAAGLRVCAWQFVYGTRPVAEAAAGAAARRNGAECLIIDAESAYEGKYRSAATYMRELRSRVGSSYPLGFTSFPYVSYHSTLPYSVFLGSRGAQVNMPQVYWRDIGTTVTTAMTRTWRENRIYGRPIVPIGQTYQSAPTADIRRFRAFARAWSAPGYSWWVWNTTSAGQWNALASSSVPSIEPGDPGWPVLARGAQGDPVRQGQRLLIAAGYEAVEANGIFGSVTAASVRAFQQSRDIPVTGSLNAATWPALMKSAAARMTRAHRAAAATRSR